MERTLPIPEILNLFALVLLASLVIIVHAELAFRGESGVDVLPNVLGQILGFQAVSVEVIVDFPNQGLVGVWAGV